MSTDTLAAASTQIPVTRAAARYQLRGTLAVASPLHVGAGVGRDGIDSSVMLDGEGHPLIPGTTLAGVLREVLARAERENPALLGGIDVAEGASRLVVHDARVTRTKDGKRYKREARREVRNATSIDSERGVAGSGLLFSREVVVTGTQFDLAIEVETGGSVGDDDAKAVLSLIEDALTRGLPLGGAVTRGLGAVKLTSPRRTVARNLGTRAGMLAVLATKDPTVGPVTWDSAPIGDRGGSRAHLLRATIEWHPIGTIMAGVARRGEIDVAPQTTEVRRNRTHEIHLVLPGSGVKGALRARAELIAAALGTDAAKEAVTWLFGVARQDQSAGGAAPDSEQGRPQVGRGRLSVADTTTLAVLDDDAWRWLEELEQLARGASPADVENRASEVRDRLAALNGRTGTAGLHFEILDRVAVDRWLGGASDGLLFTALEPTASTWDALHLDLDLFRVPDEARGSVVALLLLVLRDLERGWIPFGRGTRRGWGDVVVDRASLSVGEGLRQDFGALDIADLFSENAVSEVAVAANELVSALATGAATSTTASEGGER